MQFVKSTSRGKIGKLVIAACELSWLKDEQASRYQFEKLLFQLQ